MKFKWFNRPSTYFKLYPDLLCDTGAVSSFLTELEDLKSYLLCFETNLILSEVEAEIKWLKENRQDNKQQFD